MPSIDLTTVPAVAKTQVYDLTLRNTEAVQETSGEASTEANTSIIVFAYNPNSQTASPVAPIESAATALAFVELGLNIKPAAVIPPGGIVNPITNEIVTPAPTFVPGLDDEYDIDPIMINAMEPLRALMRVSPVMPRLNEVPIQRRGRPNPEMFVPETITVEEVGYLSVVLDHETLGPKDVTFFRNVPCHIDEYVIEEPYGPTIANITFPQVSMLEPRVDEVSRFVIGNNVEIRLVDVNGVVLRTLWEGYVINLKEKVAGGKSTTTLECQGTLFQADHIAKQPELIPREEDIGIKIARNLNAVEGRRYGYITEVETGITSFSRGEWQPLLSGYVGDMLAEAITDDGLDQWTLSMRPGRRPWIHLKSATASNVWTLSIGTPGVEVDINRDMTQEPTHIYGAGIDSFNRGYANLRTPDWTPDRNVPDFPGTINLGDSGKQVKKLQKRLRRLGYETPYDGKYSAKDARAVKVAQRDAGLSETGVVNENTWNALFTIGTMTGKLHEEYYAPFAHEKATEPWLYNAVGTRRDQNPSYNKRKIQVHRYRRFADGTSKEFAFKAAAAELERDGLGYAINNRVGTITLNACPEEGSRWEIMPGHTINLKGFHGSGMGGHDELLLRVITVTVASDLQTVTLQVDTNMRDSLTLDAIKSRNREAATMSRRRSRRASTPSRPLVDMELIGKVEEHNVVGGRWKVVRVPVGFDPTISVMDWTASPPTKFCLAIFSKPITSGELTSLVPYPLSDIPGGPQNWWVAQDKMMYKPWEWVEAATTWTEPYTYKGLITNTTHLPKTASLGDTYLDMTDGQIWVWNDDPVSAFYPSGKVNTDPVTDTVDPFAPSEQIVNELKDAGFIDAVGGPGQSAGYWPGQESNKDDEGNTIDPVTGKHYDEVTISIESMRPPFIWIAEWAEDSCTMEGVIRVEPEQW